MSVPNPLPNASFDLLDFFKETRNLAARLVYTPMESDVKVGYRRCCVEPNYISMNFT